MDLVTLFKINPQVWCSLAVSVAIIKS